MKSILSKVISTIEIQKSKFICILIPLPQLEDVKTELDNIKNEYKGATHYCYSYIFDQTKRFSDDGEPSGTAGMPILNVLESQELNRVLAVVIRYFGGIKLGTGGLVRAYTNSVVEVLEQSTKIELIYGKKIELIFPYNQEQRILSLIYPYEALDKKYDEKIHYIIFLPDNYLANLENYSYQILDNKVLGQEKKA